MNRTTKVKHKEDQESRQRLPSASHLRSQFDRKTRAGNGRGQEEPVPCRFADIGLRASAVLCREIAFIHNREFNRSNAELIILGDWVMALRTVECSSTAIAPSVIPAYFAELHRTPLLSRDDESSLFRRMNYLKFRANALRSALDPHHADLWSIEEIERLLTLALEIRDRIITANLRLVVSIARRFTNEVNSFDELLSDGNLTLMRAVEKFDYSRGFKFSTYATYAIQRDLYRQRCRRQDDRARFVPGVDEFADDSGSTEEHAAAADEHDTRSRKLLALMQAELDERERYVLAMRFGLGDADVPQTLQQIGDQLGVSKERVRQLETRALEKLKQHAAGNA